MGLLDRLRGLFVKRGPSLTANTGQMVEALMGSTIFNRGPPKRGTRELMIAFRESPWLRAGLSRIARGVASLQWKVYVRTENPIDPSTTTGMPRGWVPPFDLRRDRAVLDHQLRAGPQKLRTVHRQMLMQMGLLREVPDHPVLAMLEAGYKPLLITGRQSLEISQVWRDLKGEAFWVIVRENGVPTGYLPVPPHWVVNVPNGAMQYYRISFSSLQILVQPEDMVWIRDLDAENPLGRGTGTGESLGDEIETDEYASKYVKAWFWNGAMPSAIVSAENATQTQLKELQIAWEQEHRGFQMAHRLRYASGKMNVTKLDNSFRDQQLIEVRRSLRDTFVQVYGLPPELIGIIENSNRSTIGAAEYIFAIGVRHPRQENFREALQQQLVPQFDPRAVLDYEAETPVDPEFALEVMTAQPGAFKLNEWRGTAGFDPDPELEGVRPPLAMPGQEPGAGADDEEEDPTGGDGDEPTTEDGDDDPNDRHEPRFALELAKRKAS